MKKNQKNRIFTAMGQTGNFMPAKITEILNLLKKEYPNPKIALKYSNSLQLLVAIEGIAVDTHVGRLSRRLGLTKNSNPEKIEEDMSFPEIIHPSF